MSEDKLATIVDFPMEWLEKALSITGSFEGKDTFTNVTGNFDGQGLSAGVLQWCIAQGSLQDKILKPYLLLHGSIDRLNIFPEPIMDKLAHAPVDAGLRLAIIKMNNSKGVFKKSYSVKPEWKSAWIRFLSLPAVHDLQLTACEGVAQQSMRLCKEWDMVSLRSFCWFFDLITQNGGLKGVTKPRPDTIKKVNAILFASQKNQEIWTKRTLNDEQVTLLIASHERAKLSRAEYQRDVMDRKGTIAVGKGVVHGDLYEITT